jgi:hypothetical protein
LIFYLQCDTFPAAAPLHHGKQDCLDDNTDNYGNPDANDAKSEVLWQEVTQRDLDHPIDTSVAYIGFFYVPGTVQCKGKNNTYGHNDAEGCYSLEIGHTNHSACPARVKESDQLLGKRVVTD